MLKRGNTLHFINRVDETNCGDKYVVPLLYYYDYFSRFQIMRHDIRFVEFDCIAPNDVVILGGGGLFDYSEAMNRTINQILHTGAAVIAWSPGFNTHFEYDCAYSTKVDFDRFALLTVRDFDNEQGFPFLPDVTCKLPQLDEHYEIKRKFGLACHKDYPIDNLPYDRITNNAPIDEIMRFIGETEIVLSDSYHMIYWSLLQGKKVVCVASFSTKFQFYRHKPVYWVPGTESAEACAERAVCYDVLDEYRAETDTFFEKVKAIIEERLHPVNDPWSAFKHVTKEALLFSLARNAKLSSGDSICSQLFIDDGSGFDEGRKRLSIAGVCGGDECTACFDLSSFEQICQLRFDPLEGQRCEVSILDAYSEKGNVRLQPYLSLSCDGWDRFLTSDPQYYISEPCSGMLTIRFRLRHLTHFQEEQAIAQYDAEMRNAYQALEGRCAEQQKALQELSNADAALRNAYHTLEDRCAEQQRAFQELSTADAALRKDFQELKEADNALLEAHRVLVDAYQELTQNPLIRLILAIRRRIKAMKNKRG